jgi:hypothetical protein
MYPPRHSRTKSNRLNEKLRCLANLAELEPARGLSETCPRCCDRAQSYTFIGLDGAGASVYLCSPCYAELADDREPVNKRAAALWKKETA